METQRMRDRCSLVEEGKRTREKWRRLGLLGLWDEGGGEDGAEANAESHLSPGRRRGTKGWRSLGMQLREGENAVVIVKAGVLTVDSIGYLCTYIVITLILCYYLPL